MNGRGKGRNVQGQKSLIRMGHGIALILLRSEPKVKVLNS